MPMRCVVPFMLTTAASAFTTLVVRGLLLLVCLRVVSCICQGSIGEGSGAWWGTC